MTSLDDSKNRDPNFRGLTAESTSAVCDRSRGQATGFREREATGFGNNRWMMWLLGLLFIIPSLAAVTLFYQPGLINLGQTNKGHLHTPPLKLSDEKQLENKWWVLIVCQNQCEQYLDKVKRIRMALGRQMYQVNQGLITPQQFTEEKLKTIEDKNNGDTHLLKINLALNSGVYISDPRGFVMLSYDLMAPSDDIYSDLKHLLKVSNMSKS